MRVICNGLVQTTTPINGRTGFRAGQNQSPSAPLHSGSLVAPGFESTTRRPSVGDNNHKATTAMKTDKRKLLL
ncbi:hypothetical protein TNCV_2307941 [Trichonephila clavipes]|nr:hypothetical protein TNCV_2307941 [Trichonephila clavipes]